MVRIVNDQFYFYYLQEPLVGLRQDEVRTLFYLIRINNGDHSHRVIEPQNKQSKRGSRSRAFNNACESIFIAFLKLGVYRPSHHVRLFYSVQRLKHWTVRRYVNKSTACPKTFVKPYYLGHHNRHKARTVERTEPHCVLFFNAQL